MGLTMDKLNILDVLLTYKNDSDKIAILGKSIEMIIDYTDKISIAFAELNTNVTNIAKAVMMLETEVKRINGDVTDLKQIITTNLTHLESAVATNILRLEETVKESTGQTGSGSSVTATPAAATPRTSIVEESLMKPSQIGGGSMTPGPSPIGGGMSIRSAMMAEIKQRLRGSDGDNGTPASQPASHEIGGGYVPQIHQPREAKSLEGGLVSKMNKLLDAKFQKMTPGESPTPSGPPSIRAPPPSGPPSARAPPPSAPPSARSPPPVAPTRAPLAAPPSISTPPSTSSNSLFPAEIPDDDKKKDKKKDKKDKGKKDSQLSDLERKIREKLG